MILDLGLSNVELYRGLAVDDLAGKRTLTTKPEDAIPILVENLSSIPIDPEEVVLTGGMAIWAYLVIFHLLHGRTKRIYYQDGMGRRVLVAAHG